MLEQGVVNDFCFFCQYKTTHVRALCIWLFVFGITWVFSRKNIAPWSSRWFEKPERTATVMQAPEMLRVGCTWNNFIQYVCLSFQFGKHTNAPKLSVPEKLSLDAQKAGQNVANFGPTQKPYPHFWKQNKRLKPVHHPTNYLIPSTFDFMRHFSFTGCPWISCWIVAILRKLELKDKLSYFLRHRPLHVMEAKMTLTNTLFQTWQSLYCPIVLDPNIFRKTQKIQTREISSPRKWCLLGKLPPEGDLFWSHPCQWRKIHRTPTMVQLPQITWKRPFDPFVFFIGHIIGSLYQNNVHSSFIVKINFKLVSFGSFEIVCSKDNGQTRSSAQGNCRAKSIAGNVVDSSLSSLSEGEEGSSQGGSRPGGGGGGRGNFIHPAVYCTATHGACPKGTSHN